MHLLAAFERPSEATPIEIDLTMDLWKCGLLVLSVQSDSEMKTSSMIEALPDYIALSDEHLAVNENRKRLKVLPNRAQPEIAQNSKSNSIYQAYAQDIRGRFKITRKWLDFVGEYFKS